MNVQAVTSAGGIEAWLVEDYALPTLSLRYAFEGGSAQDPLDKDGLSNFVALALQHGGQHTGQSYLRRVEELALRVGYRTSKDWMFGGLDTLTDNRGAAAQLLHSVLAKPHFHTVTVEAVRRRLLGFQTGEARTPSAIASGQWAAVNFAGHPYERPISGTAASVRTITVDDLDDYIARVFARNRLKVVAVGEISAEELGRFLDDAFGELPARANITPVPALSPVQGGRLRVVDMDVSQSAVMFSLSPVPDPHEPGFIAAELLTHIAGGKGGISRLAEEIRNRQGLACKVRTTLDRFGAGHVFRGTTATRNDMVGKTLEIVREELQKLSHGLITTTDLETAKGYLIGSYPLRFDAHAKIAVELLEQFIIGFGPTFFEARKDMISAVTLDDLKAVAARMLNPDNLVVSIAGSPALQPARVG